MSSKVASIYVIDVCGSIGAAKGRDAGNELSAVSMQQSYGYLLESMTMQQLYAGLPRDGRHWRQSGQRLINSLRRGQRWRLHDSLV
jgi:hypothetical protein